MITLRQMRFLTAVAETLNFSRAAEICFVTQPTLSAGIKELEDRLGVQLIERTRRSVMLTPLGEGGRSAGATPAAGSPPRSKPSARAHQNPFEGDLKLGSIPTIGPYLLPACCPRSATPYPGCASTCARK